MAKRSVGINDFRDFRWHFSMRCFLASANRDERLTLLYSVPNSVIPDVNQWFLYLYLSLSGVATWMGTLKKCLLFSPSS